MKNKGFTLIELLVVIAIIGILSAIVLASLDTARSKAQDAAARADLDDARAQAENFYDSNGQSYLHVCTTAANNVKPGILDMLQGAASAEGGAVNAENAAETSGNVACEDTATQWVAETALKNTVNGQSYWCVDNTGTSTAASAIAATTYVCP